MSVNKTRVRSKKIITESVNKSIRPTHLKFNFSFITHEKDLTDEHKIVLFNRIREISNDSYLVVQQKNKKIGIEYESVSIKKEIPPEFYNNEYRKTTNKFAIFRLYPNDNPIIARVIGKVSNNIFYIFYIDIGGKLYQH